MVRSAHPTVAAGFSLRRHRRDACATDHFQKQKVITLDPGAGTGAYILAALQHGLSRVEQEKGPGMRANFATQAARNLHAFELWVGPYAVAHLRPHSENPDRGKIS